MLVSCAIYFIHAFRFTIISVDKGFKGLIERLVVNAEVTIPGLADILFYSFKCKNNFSTIVTVESVCTVKHV